MISAITKQPTTDMRLHNPARVCQGLPVLQSKEVWGAPKLVHNYHKSMIYICDLRLYYFGYELLNFVYRVPF